MSTPLPPASSASSTPQAATVKAAAPKRKRHPLTHPIAKPIVFLLCLLPLAWLFYRGFTNHLGANPAETVIHATGDWTLRFLCITLAVTPVRTWLSQPNLLRFRRMLGLFTFFYVCLHFLSYGWLDKGFDFAEIAKDIAKRPYILVGTAALLLMAPLAATSFNRAIKAMGARRWQNLHRLIYVIALLGLLHFFWLRSSKNNFAEVSIYAAVLAVLLGWRVLRWARTRRSRSTA
ncbi:hypothetical protein BH09PSE5_BH09PSE5_41650 [soil metagenome]